MDHLFDKLDPATSFVVRAKAKGRRRPGFFATVKGPTEADAVAVVRMHGYQDGFWIAPTFKGPWREISAAGAKNGVAEYHA